MNLSAIGWPLLQVKLLQFVRPQDFDNFKHFVRWRDTTANILLQILQRAAQVPASEDDKYDCCPASTQHIMLESCIFDMHICHAYLPCTSCSAVTVASHAAAPHGYMMHMFVMRDIAIRWIQGY